MDFLYSILANVVVELATHAAVNVPGLFLGMFRSNAHDLKAAELCKLLEQLGSTSAESVRELVHKTTQGKAGVSDQQREDLVAVLVSLSRGATLLNSQGDPRSSYLKTSDLLDQLLLTVQPKRRAGEPVCPNHSFKLTRFLGMGAYGEVWLSTNPLAKNLPPRAYKFFTHEGANRWMLLEKDNLLAVRDKLKGHASIVQLVDVNIPQDGYPYLELEYVDGGSLEDWISDRRRSERPLHKQDLMRQIVRGVAAAHRAEVFHCDLKPANILLMRGTEVLPKITDFGLAASSLDESATDSAESVLRGTSMYWPPEVCRPFIETKPAQRDVFALGVIWYQLLVERLERPPYDFANELRDRGEDSHTIRLITQCLAQPSKRFADASALEDHLDNADFPVWRRIPDGLFDVQGLVREYVSLATK